MECSRNNVPLGGPVHQVVAGNQGRQPVKDLGLGAAEGVEDGIVNGAGKGVLAVGSDAVGDDALLLGAACVALALSLVSILDIRRKTTATAELSFPHRMEISSSNMPATDSNRFRSSCFGHMCARARSRGYPDAESPNPHRIASNRQASLTKGAPAAQVAVYTLAQAVNPSSRPPMRPGSSSLGAGKAAAESASGRPPMGHTYVPIR